MSQTDSADDPEVQRNGFELYAETWNIDDEVLENFFENEFVPSDSWEDNHLRWWHHYTRHVPRCPECGTKTTGASPLETEDGMARLRLEPCGDVITAEIA